MRTPTHQNGRRFSRLALTLTLTLSFAACGGGDNGSSDDADGDDADSTSTLPDAALVDLPAIATTPGAPGTLELPLENSKTAMVGTYNLAAIGAGQVTFVIEDEGLYFTKVGEYDPVGTPLAESVVRLSDSAQGSAGRRDIHFSRPTHLLDASFIGPPEPDVIDPDEDLYPVTTIEQWLADAEAGVEWGVLDVEELEIASHRAWRFTLQSDYVGCETMDPLAPGIRDEWTGCNGAIAWDLTSRDTRGQLAVEAWDGGQSEYLWIDDVGGVPLVVSLHLGYEFDESWNARARAILESVTVA